jgi:hypothetical protein
MASHRVTVRISGVLGALLRHRCRVEGKTSSQIVRAALETYLSRRNSHNSAYSLVEESGLIGCVRGTPKDLSINRHHFKTFRKNKRGEF